MESQELFCKNHTCNLEDYDIQLQGVYVAFQDPRGVHTVLEEINIHVQTGEWVAIIGKNGSGKSTLARVIAGLLPVSKGIVKRPQQEYATQMIFQNPEAQIVGETIYEDICFGMENAAIPFSEMERRATQVLDQVGLRLPLDYPTIKLSGGQKQLLGIAGCLAVDAQVLVFDEATSMLDPFAREQIIQVAKMLHQDGKTIIWITQWMEEVVHSDRMILLDGGKISFEGTPKEFFYGKDPKPGDVHSVCEEHLFLPPYTVQVASQLIRQGFLLEPLPLVPEELGKAVHKLVNSIDRHHCL